MPLHSLGLHRPRRRWRYLVALCNLVAVGAVASASMAHEGHDHGQIIETPASNIPRAEAASDNFELVAVANGSNILVYLDWFESNAPLTDATVEVETPEGSTSAVAKDGVYQLAAPWLAQQQKVDLIFSVTAGTITDVLPLTLNVPLAVAPGDAGSVSQRLRNFLQPGLLLAGLVGFVIGAVFVGIARKRKTLAIVAAVALIASEAQAHEGHDHAVAAPPLPTATGDRAQRLHDGTTFVPKPVQRIFDLRTLRAEVAMHRRVVELPGRIIADPDASGFVQAAVGGRLSPPEGGFPRLGTPVKKGQVLAYVTPPLQAIDVSDMRQRQGELDQQIEIVSRRVARYERLAPSGAVAATQLEEAKLELQGLKTRRAALDTARREPEALGAPVSGVIAEGTPVAGQMAQPNSVVFHIVDPQKLWIEALSFDALVGAETASAKAVSGKQLALGYRGAGFADRSQSIPVHFAIEGDAGELRPGQLVTVTVHTNEERRGIAIPRTSIVRSANGQDFVYAHVSAERFEPRAVRIEPLDGDRVLVVAGVEAEQRVVIQGAELLDHVR